MEAIERAGYEPGQDISIALDVAASEFFEREEHSSLFSTAHQSKRRASEMIIWYDSFVERYPIHSIEDGLDESDWDG
jgi:enolase